MEGPVFICELGNFFESLLEESLVLRMNFTIETYCDKMSHRFNNLNQAGSIHTLTEYQKVFKFKAGLQEEKAQL